MLLAVLMMLVPQGAWAGTFNGNGHTLDDMDEFFRRDALFSNGLQFL